MAYTTINKSSDNFNTITWAGNNSARSLTGVGHAPDLIWIKDRSENNHHALFDKVRGVNKYISSSSTTTELNQPSSGYVSAFDSDGFSGVTGSSSYANWNKSGNNYVAWNWKANGAGSANTAGSVNSTVSVNSTAGFSIVKYVGDGATTTTVGHGLGVVPQVILIKNLETATNWTMYHHSMGNTGQLYLDTTNSFTTDADTFKNTTPTNTLWTMSNSAKTNQGSRNHIAYCFAEKTGYSKFGSYGGNQNADGNFIYLGFKPAFVMIKRYSAGNPTTTNWNIFDTKRDGYNGKNENLFPNTSDAESSGNNRIDMLSNGFKLRTTTADINNNGHNYIYMAFAEAPLVGTNNVPCTAR